MRENPIRFWLGLFMVVVLCLRAHGTITVLDDWRMGEGDPGAVNGGYVTNTLDSAAGDDTLTNQPAGGVYPVYSANVSGLASYTTGSDLSQFYTNGQYAVGNVVSSLTNNFGMELWVYPTAPTGGAVIAYNGNTGSSGCGIYQAGTNCYLLVGGVAFSQDSVPLAINAWTHLAMVDDGGMITLYTNGVPGFTMSSTPNSPVGSFLIGADNSGLEAFNGGVDEVRVFNFKTGRFNPTNLLAYQPLVVTTNADSGTGSLRGAVAAAIPGDTITFTNSLSGQLITLSGGLALQDNLTIDASALPDGIRISVSSHAPTFTINAANVLLQNLNLRNATNSIQAGAILNEGGLTLNNVVVRDNAATAGGAIYNTSILTLNNCTLAGNTANTGGAIFSLGGSVTLNSCTLDANTAGLNGGGIECQGGTLALNNCSLTDNAGDTQGGGICNETGSTLVMNGCVLSGNLATNGAAVYNQGGATLALCVLMNNSSTNLGAGIYNTGSILLNTCTISDNSGLEDGGGIYNAGSAMTLNNCTISGNNAPFGYGGGIFSSSGATLNNCTLANNSAFQGGGIYNLNNTLTANNCTFSGNSANSGGGIYNTGAILNLVNCTIVQIPGEGDAIYGDSGHLSLLNTIALQIDLNGEATLGFAGGNIVVTIGGAWSGTTPIAADPGLAPLGNYGGPTQTMPPLPGSAAIDAGDDSVTNTLATDQRGYPRLAGLHVDIGAVEGVSSPATPLVLTGVASPGNGTFQFGFTNYEDLSFTVYASTNLALPLDLWSNLGPAVDNPPGSGLFQFADPGAANLPQRFYRVTSP